MQPGLLVRGRVLYTVNKFIYHIVVLLLEVIAVHIYIFVELSPSLIYESVDIILVNIAVAVYKIIQIRHELLARLIPLVELVVISESGKSLEKLIVSRLERGEIIFAVVVVPLLDEVAGGITLAILGNDDVNSLAILEDSENLTEELDLASLKVNVHLNGNEVIDVLVCHSVLYEVVACAGVLAEEVEYKAVLVQYRVGAEYLTLGNIVGEAACISVDGEVDINIVERDGEDIFAVHIVLEIAAITVVIHEADGAVSIESYLLDLEAVVYILLGSGEAADNLRLREVGCQFDSDIAVCAVAVVVDVETNLIVCAEVIEDLGQSVVYHLIADSDNLGCAIVVVNGSGYIAYNPLDNLSGADALSELCGVKVELDVVDLGYILELVYPLSKGCFKLRVAFESLFIA